MQLVITILSIIRIFRGHVVLVDGWLRWLRCVGWLRCVFLEAAAQKSEKRLKEEEEESRSDLCAEVSGL
jgi:hypothetical protein